MTISHIKPLSKVLAIGGILAIALGTAKPSPAQWLSNEMEPVESSAQNPTRIAKDKPAATPPVALDKDKVIQISATPNTMGQLPIDFRLAQNSNSEPSGRRIAFATGFGTVRPHTLQGPTVATAVRTGAPKLTGFRVPLRLTAFNVLGPDQTLTLGVLPGDQARGTDLTFRDQHITSSENSLGYAVNIFALSYEPPTFDNGEREVNISPGETAHEIRLGGGFEIFSPLDESTAIALGLNYQQISFSDAHFGSQNFSQDEGGNALTASGNDQDDLLTLNLNVRSEGRNNLKFPTQGSRFQLGIDQAIPLGAADSSFTRAGLNYTAFFPIDWIRVPETSGTLLFNLQGGTIPLDGPPSYEAYSLGGTSSVRGYSTGEVGNPRNFLQGTLEYRFPFASLNNNGGLFEDLLGENLVIAGNIFLDAATGFDSDVNVLGQPGVVREKPGEGYGYGVGILATSSIGLLRLEFAITDMGDTSVNFGIGDRF